ncbi:MAG: hypothetical protein HC875_04490 [Anaerolineales bacterium]|nr:hypothetical protein [Anaerolineales bacterium]
MLSTVTIVHITTVLDHRDSTLELSHAAVEFDVDEPVWSGRYRDGRGPRQELIVKRVYFDESASL